MPKDAECLSLNLASNPVVNGITKVLDMLVSSLLVEYHLLTGDGMKTKSESVAGDVV